MPYHQNENGLNSTGARISGSTKLRQYLADPSKIILCPGVYDGLTTRIALKAGFDALYMVATETRPIEISILSSC